MAVYNYANSTLCSTLVLLRVCHEAINIARALSVYGLWTPRILGRDFTRPFDHQRRNARAKVRVEMPLTLKCAILYGALLCRGSSIESLPSVCTDKSTYSNVRKNTWNTWK